MATDDLPILVIAPDRSVPRRLQAVWRYRELLVGLVRKELKVKYKDSSLGFFWSMLNPAMYLAVFYVVFQIILGSGIPYFAIYLLSGLLAWNLFNGSVTAATGSIVNNGSLVNKVYFPREILPLSTVGANLVHFFLQTLVLLAALVIFRYDVAFEYLWLVIPALAVLLVLAAGFGILFAALNVYARDLQHLLELVMLAWFWLTPIVYAWQLPADKLSESGLSTSLTLLNPIVPIVISLQRGIWGTDRFVGTDGVTNFVLPDGSPLWYLRNLAIVGVIAVGLFIAAVKTFGRLEANFAEEL
ncbi:MAG TPA: ABC transporter permease [Acidimicrobiales bacterium]